MLLLSLLHMHARIGRGNGGRPAGSTTTGSTFSASSTWRSEGRTAAAKQAAECKRTQATSTTANKPSKQRHCHPFILALVAATLGRVFRLQWGRLGEYREACGF